MTSFPVTSFPVPHPLLLLKAVGLNGSGMRVAGDAGGLLFIKKIYTTLFPVSSQAKKAISKRGG